MHKFSFFLFFQLTAGFTLASDTLHFGEKGIYILLADTQATQIRLCIDSDSNCSNLPYTPETGLFYKHEGINASLVWVQYTGSSGSKTIVKTRGKSGISNNMEKYIPAFIAFLLGLFTHYFNSYVSSSIAQKTYRRIWRKNALNAVNTVDLENADIADQLRDFIPDNVNHKTLNRCLDICEKVANVADSLVLEKLSVKDAKLQMQVLIYKV